MVTTIQVSKELVQELRARKMYDKESYEDVIWDFVEPFLELSEEAKKDIELSIKEYNRGNFITFEEVKKELGF